MYNCALCGLSVLACQDDGQNIHHGFVPKDELDTFPCPINCNGGCPVCAPDEHTGITVYMFILKYFNFTKKEAV